MYFFLVDLALTKQMLGHGLNSAAKIIFIYFFGTTNIFYAIHLHQFLPVTFIFLCALQATTTTYCTPCFSHRVQYACGPLSLNNSIIREKSNQA